MTVALRVVVAGAQTTVQDLGRAGAARYGVPRGGAMDRFALRAANRLLGNPPDAAGLEIVASQVAFAVLRPLLAAITGADVCAMCDDHPLPLWTALLLRPGDYVTLSGRTSWGARVYLALAGGVDVPVVLGARGTHLPGGFGGLQGRPLRAGDTVAALDARADPQRLAGGYWPTATRPSYSPAPTLRFVPGPHHEYFGADTLAALAATPLRVSASSNRMGYRLEGVTLPYARPASLASLGVIPGAIQIPPDGAPILLVADAQTTGGYPVIGAVIGADMPLAAQLLPGDALRLAPVGMDEAIESRRAYAAWCAATPETDETQLQLALAGA